MQTKELADEYARRFLTRNPFDLASCLSIAVLHEPLGEILGYYNRCYRQKFIHINCDLPGELATFTCAHEVAHSILHPGLNTPFLRKNTCFSVDKLETQANQFALDFIFDDFELLDFLDKSADVAAAYMGVDHRLATYRMSSVQPTLLPQFD